MFIHYVYENRNRVLPNLSGSLKFLVFCFDVYQTNLIAVNYFSCIAVIVYVPKVCPSTLNCKISFVKGQTFCKKMCRGNKILMSKAICIINKLLVSTFYNCTVRILRCNNLQIPFLSRVTGTSEYCTICVNKKFQQQ